MLLDYVLVVLVCIGFFYFWENKLRSVLFRLDQHKHPVPQLYAKGYGKFLTTLLTCIFCYSSWMAFMIAFLISSNIYFALPCLISVGGWVAWVQSKIKM